MLAMQHGRQQHGISKPPPAKGKAATKYNYKQCLDAHDAGAVRVVYIASPMKLTASPEEFRAVVQELTGRHSNIADRQYVDTIHPPPPPPPACASNVASATAAPPPVAGVPPVPTPPLPRQIFQSYDHAEHEQAAGLCYGQGYYW